MRSICLMLCIIIFSNLDVISQNIYRVNIEEVPPTSSTPTICISNCEECGKLIFSTFFSNLIFESSMGNIKDQKVTRELNADGIERFTYQIVTKALPIQHIIIKGPNLIAYDLTVVNLEPVSCKYFLINSRVSDDKEKREVPRDSTGSYLVNSIPQGATISLSNDPKFKEVTPYSFINHATGTLRLKLEKINYISVDTSIIILPGKSSSLTVTMKPEKTPLSVDSIKILKNYVKAQGKKQTFWLVSTIVSGGAGGYFIYAADKKYKDYQNATDSGEASTLHKTVALYDKLAPVFFGLAGVCAVEFTIHTIKRSKGNERLKLYMTGQGARLTYNF
jgi:hypothetical protein